MLNTPWQPTISRSCSIASRSATRNASVPGLPVFSATGIARCRMSPESQVFAPKVAGFWPNCFS